MEANAPTAADQSLTARSESQRAQALRQRQVRRPHVEDGVRLTRIAAEAGVAERTVQVHRQLPDVAAQQSGPVPGYATVYAIIRCNDPAVRMLAHERTKRYQRRPH